MEILVAHPCMLEQVACERMRLEAVSSSWSIAIILPGVLLRRHRVVRGGQPGSLGHAGGGRLLRRHRHL